MGNMNDTLSTCSTQVQPFGQARRIIGQPSHRSNEASETRAREFDLRVRLPYR